MLLLTKTQLSHYFILCQRLELDRCVVENQQFQCVSLTSNYVKKEKVEDFHIKNLTHLFVLKLFENCTVLSIQIK